MKTKFAISEHSYFQSCIDIETMKKSHSQIARINKEESFLIPPIEGDTNG
ncbi:hypothetical protein LEP1GSC193_3347 [Leptospira alstonii serovar Pingchang str. 80-412]|uniref:Uncharacterized protein n=2 Tax=Leptospira alstonii TaxID=28452 RepID=M6D0U4_9LEPT|nr:hypothetical protein LEP1GSC194_3483 [Leptospira alstonii serovar Sichuan str. 79601]EQA80519.1 hypothetical protein LEP1GSC193_3347 [Leptospira alstonii serovar Pingchang str. 80-412]